jgi:hypothetical integral membrane protein (TIGR02206 family)
MPTHYVIELFSNYWWKGILFSFTGILFFLYMGTRMQIKDRERLASCLGWSLLLLNLFHQVYLVARQEWHPASSLPLNLCSITGLLSGIALIIRKQIIFEFLLFCGVSGAIHSLITPEMTLGNKGWHPYDYYISHAGIILSALYLSVVLNFFPRPGSWWRILLYTQPLLVLVYIVNINIGANYMYLVSKPAARNLFVRGDWPWYIIGFEIAGILHFYLLWMIFKKTNLSFGYIFKIS